MAKQFIKQRTRPENRYYQSCGEQLRELMAKQFIKQRTRPENRYYQAVENN